MFSAEALEAVGPTQYGVAWPGGPVGLRHRIKASLASDPTLAIAALDIANMHGSMNLVNIQEQVRHCIPCMWPRLAPWLRIPRNHRHGWSP